MDHSQRQKLLNRLAECERLLIEAVNAQVYGREREKKFRAESAKLNALLAAEEEKE
jgi:hypothetical protein